jgi:hypothetical protein
MQKPTQSTQRNPVDLKRNIAGFIALFAAILYATGYWICEYVHGDDMTPWRQLRDTLNGVVIACLVVSGLMPTGRLKVASLWMFGVLCFGNLVDRWWFDITTFVGSDYWLTGTAIVIFIIKLRAKNATHTG